MRAQIPDAGEDCLRPDWTPDSSCASPAELEAYIRNLLAACAADPQSADLHTCLGVAYAARHQFGKAMSAFRNALQLMPGHFFARLRYAEVLHSRGFVRKAERQAHMAAESARTRAESAMAGRLLSHMREANFISSLDPRTLCGNKNL